MNARDNMTAALAQSLAEFNKVACWRALQLSQMRQHLAEHLTDTLLPAEEKASADLAPTATPQPEADPVPLRWGLDDVMYGDDDTTTLLLSGPDLEPYWLELDLERTAALQDCLTGPGEPEPEPLTLRQQHVLSIIRSSRGDGIWGTGDLVPLYRAWHTRNTRGEARRDLYALRMAGHLVRLGPDHAVRYCLNPRKDGQS